MPAKTDLNAIKQIAKTLVYLDFKLTKFSPIVVQHPFTDTGITATKQGSSFRMINLLEDQKGLTEWRKDRIRFITEADDVYSIYMQVTKPYALSFLKEIEDYISKEDLSALLRSIWMRIEFVSDNPVYTKDQFVRLFRKCDPQTLMEPDEYEAYQSFPDTLEIYRGVRKDSKKVEGMSWTTNKSVAYWFADRFAGKASSGDVYKAVINKRDVLAYFTGRTEDEVVVDTKGLRSIEKQHRTPLLDDIISDASKQSSSFSSAQNTLSEEPSL